MAFSGFPFPPETPIFPKAEVVRRYLASYSDTFMMRRFIRFNTRVVHMDYMSGHWVVHALADGSFQETVHADLVMIANGYYASARLPKTPGAMEWVKAGLATHSMWYRHPPVPALLAPSHSGLEPQQIVEDTISVINEVVILVVGGGPSGQDLCTDFLALVHQSERHTILYTIIHSTNHSLVEDVPYVNGNTLKRRGRIASYHDVSMRSSTFDPLLSHDNEMVGAVTFESGETITNIQHAYLATGYDYTYPFIPSHILDQGCPPPPPMSSRAKKLWNSKCSVGYLARHLWSLRATEDQDTAAEHYPPTSLVFLGLLYGVSPLPLVEVQAQAALAAFACPALLDLPTEEEGVSKWYELVKLREIQTGDDERRLNEKIWKSWHKFEPMGQYDYRDNMCATFCDSQHLPHLSPHSVPVGCHQSSPRLRVPSWHPEMMGHVSLLRATWRKLEGLGEAGAFVAGVGTGPDPEVEWESCMHKLLRKGLEDDGVSSEGVSERPWLIAKCLFC